MALLQENKSDGTLVFIGCSESDILEGEKLSTIVGYVIKKLGIKEFGGKPEDTYELYCEALDIQLEGCELHHAKANVTECSKEKIINGMLALLAENERVPKFTQLIERAAEAACGRGAVKETIFASKYKKEFNSCEFIVLKVFRSGENLEIIPSLLTCQGKQVGVSGLFSKSKSESEAFIELKQKKFIVSKHDIKAIIKRIKEQAEEKW